VKIEELLKMKKSIKEIIVFFAMPLLFTLFIVKVILTFLEISSEIKHGKMKLNKV